MSIVSRISEYFNRLYRGWNQRRKWKNVTVGRNTTFGEDVYIHYSGKVVIGHDTMISARVIIHTATHDYSILPLRKSSIHKKTIIGHHVWIGTGAIILPGIRIGDYAVVGAGSVVTKNVMPGDIVVGNPAKFIKKRKCSIHKMTLRGFYESTKEDKA